MFVGSCFKMGIMHKIMWSCCILHVAVGRSSSAPVVFLLWSFSPRAFNAEIQCVWALEQLVLSQDTPVGFFWIAGILTNLMRILYEKYDLDCWLSPVTDALRGFGWNFVLRRILLWKLILSFVGITGRSGVSSPCSPVCFKQVGTSPETNRHVHHLP